MAETTLELDAKAWALLMALQADGRAPLKTLAMAAGLSVPATVERLKRLKDAGVVRSVSADVDPALAGYPVRAIVGDFAGGFRWGYAQEVPLEVIPYGDPDNSGNDLKGYNQVYLRAELYLGWAVLEPASFARIVDDVV